MAPALFESLMVSALFEILMASFGWYHYPAKISETTGHMTTKYLPDAKLNEEARNQKNVHFLIGQ